MALKKQVIGTIILGSMIAANAMAKVEMRAYCPDPRKTMTYTESTLEDYADYLKANRIVNVSGDQMDVKFLEEFLFEYKKFPESLRGELIKNLSTIHIISGTAVTDDPTWNPELVKTFDNRDWSKTVGAGGAPFMMGVKLTNQKEEERYIREMVRYCKLARCDKDWTNVKPKPVVDENPTRIVVNEMYPDQTTYHRSHGSVNLFLHEHAHSLDSIYAYSGVSSGPEWQALARDPEIREYMKTACLASDYCLNNDNEAFAELFAYYHSCSASRSHMERNAPALADYFKNLTRIKPSERSSINVDVVVEPSIEPSNEVEQNNDPVIEEQSEPKVEVIAEPKVEPKNEQVPQAQPAKKKFKLPKFKLPKIKLPKLPFEDIF